MTELAIPTLGSEMQQARTEFLARAGKLLLEHNESSKRIDQTLRATAAALGDPDCLVSVSYRFLTVACAGEHPRTEMVAELRYNMAVLGQVYALLAEVTRRELNASTALARLCEIESTAPRHREWVGIVVLGLGASALAALLGADAAAVAVTGVAAGLGLAVRRQLARWHFSLLTLPLAAAFIGALLGGVAIRLDWTQTPELALVVPALMLVPGPHLINGLFDLIDNYVPMALARLGLAAAILAASALGLVLGIEIILRDPLPVTEQRSERISLAADMVLAAVATCGFAIFYNTSGRQLWLAAALGMVGHGLRYAALFTGCRLEVATFVGTLLIGAGAAWLGRRFNAPVAVLAFAGAVTMMPGLALYRALSGAMKLAQQSGQADVDLAATMLANTFHAGLTVGGLVLGLVVGVRLVEVVQRAAK